MRFPFSRYRCAPVWAIRRSYRRPRKGRSATLQQLEAKELLTATMEIYQGNTQLSTWNTLDFGSVAVGSSATQTISIVNGGDETLSVEQPYPGMGFNVQGAFPLEVDPGNSTTLSVSMDTSNVGSASGELDLYSNDPNYSMSPFTLYLSGNVTGVPAIALFDGSTQISPGGSDSFGTVDVNASDTKQFQIDNTGSDVLNVNSLSLPSGFYTTRASR